MSFITILFPIFFVFGTGFVAQKYLSLDTKNLSKMAIYVMVPFLVFRTFYEQTINGAYGYFTVYMVGLCVIIILLATILSRLYKFTEPERCGLVLSSAFMNNGNYGTPLTFFLFGAAGLEIAIILMVIQQLLMSTLGVFYAAKGSAGNNGVKMALQTVKRMPMVYAAMAGIGLQLLHVPLGVTFMKGIDFIADAAIPFIMLTLGMQLANIKLGAIEWKKLCSSLSLKLIVSPMIAAILVMPLPLDPMTKQIMIIMAATPTAANTTMYAIQFQTEPQSVSSATLISTIMSIVTLPVVIYLAM
ncbi:AEC family transporter [Rossellomorea aquimaris]|uniref:AEC family transporter n=1 Tax=Rossellomorea aquimaris TaxID=189382 RepID=UPI001CD5ADEB|nr:AEC family transporter [Rossellomorea aquimaris]MCA1055197.1 AEC family transporter [Rossellomorea aquimaris]